MAQVFWIIRKINSPDLAPHSGPSCGAVGIVAGHLYLSKALAYADAEKLYWHDATLYEIVPVELRESLLERFGERVADQSGEAVQARKAKEMQWLDDLFARSSVNIST
jgi:hypothetical protein